MRKTLFAIMMINIIISGTALGGETTVSLSDFALRSEADGIKDNSEDFSNVAMQDRLIRSARNNLLLIDAINHQIERRPVGYWSVISKSEQLKIVADLLEAQERAYARLFLLDEWAGHYLEEEKNASPQGK